MQSPHGKLKWQGFLHAWPPLQIIWHKCWHRTSWHTRPQTDEHLWPQFSCLWQGALQKTFIGFIWQGAICWWPHGRHLETALSHFFVPQFSWHLPGQICPQSSSLSHLSKHSWGFSLLRHKIIFRCPHFNLTLMLLLHRQLSVHRIEHGWPQSRTFGQLTSHFLCSMGFLKHAIIFSCSHGRIFLHWTRHFCVHEIAPHESAHLWPHWRSFSHWARQKNFDGSVEHGTCCSWPHLGIVFDIGATHFGHSTWEWQTSRHWCPLEHGLEHLFKHLNFWWSGSRTWHRLSQACPQLRRSPQISLHPPSLLKSFPDCTLNTLLCLLQTSCRFSPIKFRAWR